MNESTKTKRKIFISHHHSDAPVLSTFKKEAELANFEVFLAHEDIEPGEHDLVRIKKEIKHSDLFLYICNEKSNNSAFCQQEIGFAHALEKTILSVMTKREHAPQGFIGRIQAHSCGDLEELYESILEYLPENENVKIKQHLSALRCKGFSTVRKENCIHLKPNRGWNDYGFYTLVTIISNGIEIGEGNIGFKGQAATREHPLDRLPTFFTHLNNDFFSYIGVDENAMPSGSANILRFLLRDVRTLDRSEIDSIKYEEVLYSSFLRYSNEELRNLMYPPETIPTTQPYSPPF